jgi:dihydroneopterin aldolase
MGLIEVKGIKLYAYHGCLNEEGSIGGHYRVDVGVQGDLGRAQQSDKLADTIDYGRDNRHWWYGKWQRSFQVDRTCGRHAFWELSPRTMAARALHGSIILVKEHPPIAGSVEEVAYTLEG